MKKLPNLFKKFLLVMVLFNVNLYDVSGEDFSFFNYRIFNELSFYHDASFFHYGTTGLGLYPYRDSSPGTPMKVRVDGVPLKSFSPFGPDMELLPLNNIDKIGYDGINTLNVSTNDTVGVDAKTDVFFLQGPKRRFDFVLGYENRISEKSNLFLGGLSNSVNGGDFLLKNELRNYYIKYNRKMKNGILTLNAKAFRDRDGLENISIPDRMGERKTDELSYSARVSDYKLFKKFNFSPVVYYSKDNSRFARYGYRKSLIETTAGVNAVIDRHLGNTFYAVEFTSDTFMFDSRIHDDSWTRNETGVNGTFKRAGAGKRFEFIGGIINSSKYGLGSEIGAEMAFTVSDSLEFFAHGSAFNGYPDTGHEYFPSLIFSDSSIVSDLEKFQVSELEAGFKMEKEKLRISASGFLSSSDFPFFTPSPAVFGENQNNSTISSKSDRRNYFGYRFSGTAEKIKKFRYIFDFNGCQRFITGSSVNDRIWPYSSFEMFSRLRANGSFFNGNMNATVFGMTSLYNWEDAGTTPSGFYFIADAGIVLQVKTVELYYKVENITGEQIYWFDSISWLGRNELWGARWVFLN